MHTTRQPSYGTRRVSGYCNLVCDVRLQASQISVGRYLKILMPNACQRMVEVDLILLFSLLL
jgi:hypothetical protein